MSRECGMIGSRTGINPENETDKNHRQKPMKPLSATAAAKLAHKSKKDILESINCGDLSATKNARGHWQIDPSELNRVFPYEFSEPNLAPNQKPIKTTSETNKTSALEVELKFMREKLADKDELIDELRSQRDKWQTQAERLLLEKPGKSPDAVIYAPSPANEHAPQKRGNRVTRALGELFGAGGRAKA